MQSHTITFTGKDQVKAYRLLREERANAMGVLFDWTQA